MRLHTKQRRIPESSLLSVSNLLLPHSYLVQSHSHFLDRMAFDCSLICNDAERYHLDLCSVFVTQPAHAHRSTHSISSSCRNNDNIVFKFRHILKCNSTIVLLLCVMCMRHSIPRLELAHYSGGGDGGDSGGDDSTLLLMSTIPL